MELNHDSGIGDHKEIKFFSKAAFFCSLLSFAIATLAVYELTTENLLFRKAGGGLRVLDFIYYISAADALWFEKLGNIYSSQNSGVILSKITGTPYSSGMPVVWSPPAFTIMFPYAVVAHYSLRVAYSLWLGSAIALFLLGIIKFGSVCLGAKWNMPFMIGGVLITLLSFTTFLALALGQTSIIIVGDFLLLYTISYNLKDQNIWKATFPEIVLFLFASFKIPYLILASVLLIQHRRVASLFWGGIVVVLSGLATLVMTGFEGLHSYLENLGIFASGDIPEIYRNVFVRETMNIFTAAFFGIIDRDFLFALSNSLYVLLTTSGVIFALRPAILGNRITTIDPFSLSCAGYLLFSAYLGGYEEVFLLVPFVIYVARVKTVPSVTSFHLVVLFALAIACNHFLFRSEIPPIVLWGIKLLLLTFFLTSGRSNISRCQSSA